MAESLVIAVKPGWWSTGFFCCCWLTDGRTDGRVQGLTTLCRQGVGNMPPYWLLNPTCWIWRNDNSHSVLTQQYFLHVCSAFRVVSIESETLRSFKDSDWLQLCFIFNGLYSNMFSTFSHRWLTGSLHPTAAAPNTPPSTSTPSPHPRTLNNQNNQLVNLCKRTYLIICSKTKRNIKIKPKNISSSFISKKRISTFLWAPHNGKKDTVHCRVSSIKCLRMRYR